MGSRCSTYSGEERRGAYVILVGKPEGRPRIRWENNIRIDLKGIS
jgi:hypothetical protein